jgi:hypothetical protein
VLPRCESVADPPVKRGQTEVAVGDERTHTARVGQRQRLAVADPPGGAPAAGGWRPPREAGPRSRTRAGRCRSLGAAPHAGLGQEADHLGPPRGVQGSQDFLVVAELATSARIDPGSERQDRVALLASPDQYATALGQRVGGQGGRRVASCRCPLPPARWRSVRPPGAPA